MKHIKLFFKLFRYFFQNLYFINTTSASYARTFAGWNNYWFAIKYADKRTVMSNVNKHGGGGKKHYVLTFGKSLLVCSRTELIELKRRKLIAENVDIIWLLNNALYQTK